MKIVHVSSQDFGGAGRAAHRLHRGLRRLDVDSTMLVMNKGTDDRSVLALREEGGVWNATPDPTERSPVMDENWKRWLQLQRRYPNRPPGLELFSDALGGVPLGDVPAIRDADVVNLHWVAGMLEHRSLGESLQGKPVVWTLHDMNAFTGGCHYAGDCEKFTTACGACPQLGSSDENDLSRETFELKRDAYRSREIVVVTPSKWLGEEAGRSALFGGYRRDVVPYGLPLETYQIMPRDDLRAKLNLSSETKLALFGAENVGNERKGFRYLLEAFSALLKRGRSDVMLGFFGDMPQGMRLPETDRIISFGRVDQELKLAMIYNVADAFALPTLEDNLPNTALESLACGTPVAAFNVGGIPDMVVEGETGALAEPRDAESLADAIERAFSMPREETSRRCRDRAERGHALDRQAERYLELYHETLGAPAQGVRAKGDVTKAEAHIERKELNEARRELEAALREKPDRIDALLDLAVVDIMQDRLADAEPKLARVLELDPGNEVAKDNLHFLKEFKRAASGGEG
ncbi:MAG: glycosyltransferase [Ignavibacteriales bacterium]|nr:glycosyltransferase [Ignavibacteriales bacterium]